MSLKQYKPKASQSVARLKNEFGLNTVFEPAASSTTIADFVFVHGLRGGSSTTWYRTQDAEYFWPKEWLPKDADFEGVRIHSFGYNSNWATWLKSPLDVHAFGQSLVEELHSNPKIKDQDTRIILIGHSMGGLVIKKACILCKTNPEFADIAERMHSFYFLGTPHRGSDLAATLNNILRVSGAGRRAFVTGLEAKSELIRILNDQFRIHYHGIRLHTFYESQPTFPVGIIVSVESATLGYAEERTQLLNATHINLAKFESVEDSNYRSLRNRLAATVQQIRSVSKLQQQMPFIEEETVLHEEPSSYETSEEQMGAISNYLSLDYIPEEILLTLDDTRLKGSCSWLTFKPKFQEWLNSDTPRYFWLKGPPACGKSILASYVIDYLKDSPTCYYFFKTGEKVIPSLSSFLRSMAYQMARTNPAVREALFQLSQQGPPIDIRNHKSIWHNVFTGCVSHEKFKKPHYWVIDALDEAVDRGPLDEYFLLLSKIDDNIPLKVFITSRPSQALDNLFPRLPTITESITPDDSLADIQLYVETLSATLPVYGTEERKSLVKNLVEKSGSSFLWTALVMKQLRDVFTVEEVHDVLEKVPQKMSELYYSNIKKMESSRSKNLAKHVITWTICSVHLLTVDQMKDAIKLSLDTTLVRDLRTSLQYLCGQFLDVDKQSHIHVVHETARAFLTMSTLDSELRIDIAEGHQMMAMACLKYLLSDDLKYSKRRRSGTAITSKTSMADYAGLRFSEHIVRASSSPDGLFDMLVKFFNTNVLSWIEHIAQLRSLDCLIRTSRHLSSYLARRSKHVLMIPRDLAAWAVDLSRIVTQFGVNLLSNPAAIHTLIPPFCPRDSAIYRNFGCAEDGIKLVGAWNKGWDDRICSISYHDTYGTVVATLDERFAVGLSDGMVKIYRTSTCEELATLGHGESVSILEFGATSKLLASAGLRHVKLWDVLMGNELFCISTESQILAMAFNETESRLIIASRDKYISILETSHGSLLQKLPWTDTFIDAKDPGYHQTPNAVRISIEQQVMAVVYRSKPVQLWSLESQRPIGACIRQDINKHSSAGHIIHCTILNPNPSYQRLVVSYWDEVVVIFDTTTCKPLVWMTAGLDRLTISPNGKTLAGGDGIGTIKIYDFETLQFLHQIQMQEDSITSITFTSDNLRIIDVRGTQSNVWEPLALMSQDSDSHASEPSDSVRQAIDDIEVPVFDQSSSITVLHCCEESGIAFCGRSNGRVDTCKLDDPENTMRNIYKHRGSFTSVTSIDWAYKPRVAISVDSSGHFRVMQITTGARGERSAELLFEAKLEQGCAISQVLVDPTGSLVLVSSSESDSVWSVSSKQRVALMTARKRITWKWFARPSMPSQLLLVEEDVVKLFNWSDLTQLAISDDSLTSLRGDASASEGNVDTDAISIASKGDDLVFAQRVPPSQRSLKVMSPKIITTNVYVFDLSTLRPSALHPARSTSPSSSSTRNVAEIPDVDYIIGTVERFNTSYLLFISRKGWVCSVELGGVLMDAFQKHFFIPSVWRTANSSFISKVRQNEDIVFVHNGGIIVVKNGLDIGEHVSSF